MIELVIKISEKSYNALTHTEFDANLVVNEMRKAIANGTPLPKGHGDLIYRKSAETIFKNARKALYEQSRKEQIKDFHTREMMLLNAEQFVHLIEPIIEADKE